MCWLVILKELIKNLNWDTICDGRLNNRQQNLKENLRI